MKCVKVLIISFCFFSFATAQQSIRILQCKGEVPKDIKMSFDEFVDSQSNSEFETNSLLGVYQMLSSGNLVFGDESHQFMNKVADRVIKANGIKDKLYFYVLRSGLFNAFTTDDGYVFASTSLLAQVESEDEFAFVLCHEISHYLMRHNHLLNEIRKESLAETINEIRSKRKGGKKNKGISNSEVDVSLDRILRSYFEYNRKQEFQADSLGLQLYIKAGYSPTAVESLMKKLAYSFPIFEQYSFSPELFLESNIDAANFIKQKKNFKRNLVKNSYDSAVAAYRKTLDSINEFYSTHPDHDQRYLAIKNELVDYAAKTTISITPIASSLRFSLLSEQFLFMMQKNYFHISAVYLNIISQEYPETIDLKNWKYFTLIPLIRLRNAYNLSNLDMSGLEDDILSQFLRVYSKLPVLTFVNAAFANAQEVAANKSLEKVRLHYNEYLISSNRTSTFKLSKPLGQLAWKDSLGGDVIFLNQDSVVRKVPLLNDRIYKGPPTVVYNSTVIAGGPSDNTDRSKEFDLIHGNINYSNVKPISNIDAARKINNGNQWLLHEIARYGRKNNHTFNNLYISNNKDLTVDGYNTFSNTRRLVDELFNLADTVLFPVASISTEVGKKQGTKEVCVVFENSVDAKKPGLGITMINSYISHFGLITFMDLGSRFEFSGARYQFTGVVVDTENYRINYIGLYSYQFPYKMDVLSSVALKFNTDLRRNYK